MRSYIRMCALVLSLIASGRALGGDRGSGEPHSQHLLQRMRPVGGWHPYGGGLLHWWDPHCFPRYGGPDDYCRKPPPRVCWPPYPPYHIGGPPEIQHPHGTGASDSNMSR
jgi:hypothetical protein